MARKKRKKSKNKFPTALKTVVILIFLFFTYQVFQIVKVKDLTDTSMKLEQVINKKLREHDIESTQILERFQTEKKEGKLEWIKFTKKIQITSSELPGIIKDLKKAAKQQSVKVLSFKQTSKDARIEIGLKDAVLNRIVFELLEDKNLIALIVDDVGHTKNIKPFLELDIPVTYAILPNLRYSTFLAREFKRSGLPFILHMPMEPEAFPEKDPGELALMTDMNKEQVLKNLNMALKSVEGAPGLNNHMGSKFTSDLGAMKILLGIVKEKGLFYIDSVTSSESVGYRIASKIGVPAAENNFYLDNNDEYNYIIKRLEKLKAIALKRKKTVVICHITRKNTARALKRYIPEIEKENIKFVPVEDLLE